MSFRKQQELLSDSKYRSFANSVDKVLKNFEYSSEWADLISALGKLNKVLQANAKYGTIPKTITVGKRLSQCMHPALPSGVHLKAIDVYDTIFKILGPANLKLLLSVFSAGLFSLYSYASTPVCPALLKLFEVHLLPLGKHLQMFLDGLLLGLLPGLEEGSEHFENVKSLLVSISNDVDTTVFYGSVWRCVLSSPSGSVVRVAAVQLILRQFDRGKSMDDQLHFIGNDVETMVQSLCEALRDGNVLTQRSALDILLYCFPVSSSSISQSDIVSLLSSAVFVVLRRDMSLNRRLYSWILGTNSNKIKQPSSSSVSETNLFDATSKSLLYDALISLITKQAQAFSLVATTHSLQLVIGSEVKLLRVLISLLDKSEIGPHIISDVMVATIRLIKCSLNAYQLLIAYNKDRTDIVKRGYIEVKKTANLFIASFESDFIWMFLSQQFSDACLRLVGEEKASKITANEDDKNLSIPEIRNVVEMFLEILSLETYPEIQTSILPDFLRLIFNDLAKHCSSLSLDCLLSVLQMCLKVLQRVQPVHPKESGSKSVIAEKICSCTDAYLDFIKNFIANKIFNDRDIISKCKSAMYRQSRHEFSIELQDFALSTHHLHDTFTLACKVLVEVAGFPSFVRGDLVIHVREWMHKVEHEENNQQLPSWFEHLLATSMFPILFNLDHATIKVLRNVAVSAIATVLQIISFTSRLQETPGLTGGRLPPLHLAQGMVSVVILPPLTPAHINTVFHKTDFYLKGSELLWKELDNCSSIQEQLTIGRLFLKLYYDCPNDDVETKLLEDITSSEQNHQLPAVVRFCKLWCLMRVLSQDHSLMHESDKTFSRCLFVVIDQLKAHSSMSTQAKPTSQLTNQTVIMRTVSSWLRECIEEGDICNIVEPYLLLALNPRTHRRPFAVSDNPVAIDSSSDHHSVFLRNRNAQNGLSNFSSLLKEMKRYRSQDGTTEQRTPPIMALNIQEQIAEGKKSYDEILNLLSLQDHESPEKKIEKKSEDEHTDTTPEMTSSNCDNDRQEASMKFSNGDDRVRPLHSLIYVYQENFDTSQVLFSLQSLLTIAKEHSSLFIFTACTTSMSSGSYLSILLQDLMVRHERTLNSCSSFYEGVKLSSKSSMKNQMVIEILITVCMYYIRSSFLNERDLHFSVRNHEIQCTACMLMVTMMKELCSLLRDESATHKSVRSTATMSLQQFAAYLVSVFEAQNVQKSTILSLIATVLTIKNCESCDDTQPTAMNHSSCTCKCGTDMTYIKQWTGGNKSFVYVLFSHLLQLAFSIIVLEQTIIPKSNLDKTKLEGIDDTTGNTVEEGTEPYQDDESKLCCRLLHSAQQYDPAQKLASQNVFITTVMEILRIESLPEVHTECVTSLVSVLPCLRTALPHMITPIVSQMCKNIVAACEDRTQVGDTGKTRLYPPQYIETSLKTLSVIVQDCLLIGDVQTKNAVLRDSGSSNGITPNTATGNSTFGSLFGVFSQTKPTKRTPDGSELSDHAMATRNAVLNQMVRIVSCLSCVWQTVHNNDYRETHTINLLPAIDNNKLLAHNVVQFLGPLSMKYGENLLCSLAVLWDNKSTKSQSRNERATNPVAIATEEQCELLDLLAGVHGFSLDAFLQLVHKSLKSFKAPNKKDVIEENILHLALCHMKKQKSKTLLDSWPTVCSIIKEAVAFTNNSSGSMIVLSPRCYFVLLYILVDFVKVIPRMESKKDQKDLQEAAEKCIEVCNTIAGSCLEQSNWIMRRNLSVIPGPQVAEVHKTHKKKDSQSSIDLIEHPSSNEMRICLSDVEIGTKFAPSEGEPQQPPTSLELPAPPITFNSEISNELRFEHSVQALTVLSQVVSHLLDIIYGNEERDKVIPVLTSIMANVLPYLRNHNRDNVPSFDACSVFTSSMSGFQHTRRVWRKEILDLFLDAMFFKIPYNAISHWKVTIDHLMTHDKTTFKEFLSRISFSRGGSATPISIFTNKEQELEQRAMHLKRLAFVVYSSEVDQYHRNLPEIQERLSECLRLYDAPAVMEQVFLCFRVLILRVSSHNMTSLWPSVYTELTHALLQVEQALDSNFDGFNGSSKNKSQNSNENNASWYSMYLSACKLLDMILCLPSRFIPVFQLYRWCFVNISSDVFHEDDATIKEEAKEEEVFVPYCVRIQNLLNKAKPEHADKMLPIKHCRPLLTIRKLKSLQQLQLFINTVTSQSLLLQTQKTLPLLPSTTHGADNPLRYIEKQLDKDFLEAMF